MKRMMCLLFASLMALGAPSLAGAQDPKVLYKDGVLKVLQQEERQKIPNEALPYNYLMKLDTHFGLQFLKPKNGEKDFSQEPTCYHHRLGPVGIVMQTMKGDSPPPYAVVGMETGDMAAYAQKGQEVDFYEINPKVVELSLPKEGQPYFTYVQDAKKRGAKVEVYQGKPRDTFAEKAKKNHYQVIAVEMILRARLDDICVELMTKEGMKLLMDRLTDNGILCYHISNRYFNMVPVLADVAKELGCVVRHGHDPAPERELKTELKTPEHFSSDWVMVARKKETLAALPLPPNYDAIVKEVVAKSPHMKTVYNQPYWEDPVPTGKHIWTDDSKHLLRGVLHHDPTVQRLGTLVGTAVHELPMPFALLISPKAKGQVQGEIMRFSEPLNQSVIEWRFDNNQTVEDLQKGWPAGL